MTLEAKIGQMLVIGFPAGAEGLAILEAVTRRTKAGNLILFSRNSGAPDAVRATVAEARRIVSEAAGGIRPLVSTDQEGGIVARFREGMSPIPGAMAQAAALASGRIAESDIRALGRTCGEELRLLGVDWNFAPVADVNSNPQNPVIGVRSYGDDPAAVSRLSCAFAAGLADSGVLAAAKHFPGHGDTSQDSHFDLPLVGHSLERLERIELLPFKALIAQGIPVVMTSHVLFPAVEPRALPATLSPAVIGGLLRKRLGFRGLVCTDCMEMGAMTEHFPDAAVMAVEAGADLLIVSHRADRQIAAAEAILAAVRSGRIAESRIDGSVARILAAKELTEAWAAGTAPRDGGLRAPASLDLSRRISDASLCMLAGSPPFPRSVGAPVVEFIPADAQEIAEIPGSLRLPADAGAEAIRAQPGPRPILALHKPLAHPGQIDAVRRLAAACRESLGIILTDSPYDAPGLARIARAAAGPAPSILCAWERTALSTASIADFLAGKIPAAGKSPVSLPDL